MLNFEDDFDSCSQNIANKRKQFEKLNKKFKLTECNFFNDFYFL